MEGGRLRGRVVGEEGGRSRGWKGLGWWVGDGVVVVCWGRRGVLTGAGRFEFRRGCLFLPKIFVSFTMQLQSYEGAIQDADSSLTPC